MNRIAKKSVKSVPVVPVLPRCDEPFLTNLRKCSGDSKKGPGHLMTLKCVTFVNKEEGTSCPAIIKMKLHSYEPPIAYFQNRIEVVGPPRNRQLDFRVHGDNCRHAGDNDAIRRFYEENMCPDQRGIMIRSYGYQPANAANLEANVEADVEANAMNVQDNVQANAANVQANVPALNVANNEQLDIPLTEQEAAILSVNLENFQQDDMLNISFADECDAAGVQQQTEPQTVLQVFEANGDLTELPLNDFLNEYNKLIEKNNELVKTNNELVKTNNELTDKFKTEQEDRVRIQNERDSAIKERDELSQTVAELKTKLKEFSDNESFGSLSIDPVQQNTLTPLASPNPPNPSPVLDAWNPACPSSFESPSKKFRPGTERYLNLLQLVLNNSKEKISLPSIEGDCVLPKNCSNERSYIDSLMKLSLLETMESFEELQIEKLGSVEVRKAIYDFESKFTTLDCFSSLTKIREGDLLEVDGLEQTKSFAIVIKNFEIQTQTQTQIKLAYIDCDHKLVYGSTFNINLSKIKIRLEPFIRTFESLEKFKKSPMLQQFLRPKLVKPDSNSKASTSRLNQEQLKAVATARKLMDESGPGLMCVQGPPGTGKTEAIVSVIVSLLENNPRHKILVCTMSNKATDLIAGRLIESKKLDKKFAIARVGDPEKINSRVMKNLEGNADSASVCLTTFGSVYKADRYRPYSLVIVDEASMATEPELVAAISRALANKLLLIGDHKQLPPLVRSQKARDAGLQVSFFERVVENNPSAICLTVQYRMVSEICHFPSQQFYGGKLLPAGLCHNESHPLLPYMVFSLKSDQIRSNNKSLENEKEAVLVSNLAKACRGLSKDFSICVISPYKGQVELIKKSIQKEDDILVATGDSVQGREFDVTILSFVRSEKGLGFLDAKRLNVLLTRAKKTTLIVLDSEHLTKFDLFEKLMKDADNRGLSATIDPTLIVADLTPFVTKD